VLPLAWPLTDPAPARTALQAAAAAEDADTAAAAAAALVRAHAAEAIDGSIAAADVTADGA
jgi:hypothetical protein